MWMNPLSDIMRNCWLKLFMLSLATSYRVKEEGWIFKSECIVSQSIMMVCKKLGFDGVAYYSKRVTKGKKMKYKRFLHSINIVYIWTIVISIALIIFSFLPYGWQGWEGILISIGCGGVTSAYVLDYK